MRTQHQLEASDLVLIKYSISETTYYYCLLIVSNDTSHASVLFCFGLIHVVKILPPPPPENLHLHQNPASCLKVCSYYDARASSVQLLSDKHGEVQCWSKENYKKRNKKNMTGVSCVKVIYLSSCILPITKVSSVQLKHHGKQCVRTCYRSTYRTYSRISLFAY